MIWLDFETFSTTDIKCGTYRYTADCKPLLLAYALDDEPARVIDFTAGERIEGEFLRRLLETNEPICAHNSMFDRQVMRHISPAVAENHERWVDTMIKARLHSLSGSLAFLCELLGLPVDKAKDKDGRRLVLKFTKPNTAKVNGAYTKVRYTRETDPEDWAHFKEYCRLDVEAMREVNKRLPGWNSTKELWEEFWLDQKINDRGMCMDMSLVNAAIAEDEKAKERGTDKVQELTNGQVQTAGQRDALIAFIAKAYNIELPDLTASTIKRRIDDPEVPEPLRELLIERLENSKTSVQKYKAIARGLSDDGRLKGCLQFAGAARTARFSGSLFQPQNLPRGTMTPEEVEQAIPIVKAGLTYEVYGEASPVLSSCIRGCLVAPEGKKLVIADYSNIEGRTLAWLAGEAWKVKAFREFDTLQAVDGSWILPEQLASGKHPMLAVNEKGDFIHKGEDLYKVAYARPFGRDPKSINKKERQIGKVMELGLGYQGGVAAFLTFAKVYGLNLDDLAEHVKENVKPADWSRSHDMWDWVVEKKMTCGLSETTWTACNVLKNMWRDSHPHVVKFWNDCHNAANTVSKAILQKQPLCLMVNGLQFDHVGNWLRVRLPSGRYLSYPDAKPDTGMGAFTYMGVNQYSRKWSRLETYGGKLVENIVQATARDLLVQSMSKVEAAGYQVVLTVHDELVTEAPNTSEFNVEHLGSIMCDHPAWAKGLPLAAAGFEGPRYKKD